MKRSAGILALGLAVLLGPACGKKGPLQPPLTREPKPVERLTAFQRGETILLEWTNPEKYVDGRPLGALETVEIWVFDRGLAPVGRPLPSAEVEKTARLARRIIKEEFVSFRGQAGTQTSTMAFPYVFDPGPSSPKTLGFTVRVRDSKKRASDFSPPTAVTIRTCPKPPWAVEARVFRRFIEVIWSAPGSNTDGTEPENVAGYVVYRYEGGGPARKLTPSPLDGQSHEGFFRFEDRDFAFGKAYGYFIRAVAAGTEGAVESGDSIAAEIVPRDIFPPDPPAGLVAVSGPEVISLSWDPVRDEDLAGYRVWKKEAGEPGFVQLTQGVLSGNAFTDPAVQQGKTYVYAVSAEDKNGNESPKSETGPVSLKGSRG
jgi:hypothetical protein